jgi:hypothetical protein
LSEGFDAKTVQRAEFCRDKCTLCKLGRKKDSGFFHALVKLEAKVKLCPWCRAYEKVYGVPAYRNPEQP